MKAGHAHGCSESDFKAILGSFGSVLTFQRGLLQELKAEYDLLSSDDTAHFSAAPTAMVLKKWAPYLKFYRPYVRDYPGAVECIKRLIGPKNDPQRADSEFQVWMRWAWSNFRAWSTYSLSFQRMARERCLTMLNCFGMSYRHQPHPV